MQDFTLLTFSGRLTDDPELRTTSNGNSVCKFSVASNKRIGKDEERTNYIPVTVFGKQAELCAKYLTKGRQVHVIGEFETDKYTDKEGIVRKGFGCIVGESGRVNFGSGGTKVEDDGPVDFERPAVSRSAPRDYEAPAVARPRIASESMRKAQETASGGKKRFGQDRDASEDRTRYGRGRREDR